MTITQTRPVSSDFEAVELPELLARAALQDRVDRKYLLPDGALDPILAVLQPDARMLQIDRRRSFDYESVYFDTPDLACYTLAARRRRRRFKIRTRTYLDSAECWLERQDPGPAGAHRQTATAARGPAGRAGRDRP